MKKWPIMGAQMDRISELEKRLAIAVEALEKINVNLKNENNEEVRNHYGAIAGNALRRINQLAQT